MKSDRKKRTKRLSQVMMKARRNSAALIKEAEDMDSSTQVNIFVDKDEEDENAGGGIIGDNTEILEDEEGRRYRWNPRLETAEWLDQGVNDEVDAAAAAGDEVEILEDEEGRRYSWNPRLQTAEWLD